MPELNLKKKKSKLDLKSKEGFKPFPVEFLEQSSDEKAEEAKQLNALAQKEVDAQPDDTKPKSKTISKQPALLGQAFGAKSKKIEDTAVKLVKEVADAESEGKESLLSNEDLKNAAIGLIPTLLGGLLGGTEGALIGLKAGSEGVKTKLAIESKEKQQATAKELKSRELDIAETEAEGKGELRAAQVDLTKAKAAQFDPQLLAQKQLVKFQEVQGKLSEGLRKEHSAATKLIGTEEILASNERISAIAQEDASPVGDLAIIFNFMKMQDPASVVRESEFQTAAQARAWLSETESSGIVVPSAVKQGIQKLQDGTMLLPEQRKDFLSQSQNVLKGQLEAQGNIDRRFTQLAEKQSVDPTLVVDPQFEQMRFILKQQGKTDKQLDAIENKAKSMTKEQREERIQKLKAKQKG